MKGLTYLKHRRRPSVNELERQIKELKISTTKQEEQYRNVMQRILCVRPDTCSVLRINAIKEYFALFRHGLIQKGWQHQLQQDWFSKNLSPIFQLEIGTGPNKLQEQWSLLAQCFEDVLLMAFHVQLHGNNTIVRVDAELTVEINENTIRYLYPTLQGTDLGKQMIGNIIGIPVVHSFIYENHQIVQLNWATDFARAWMSVIDNVRQVHVICQAGRFSTQGFLLADLSLRIELGSGSE